MTALMARIMIQAHRPKRVCGPDPKYIATQVK